MKPIIEEIKSIQVQVEDGSMWSAHWDYDDEELIFDKQLEPPESSTPSSEAPEKSDIGKSVSDILSKMSKKSEAQEPDKEIKDTKLPESVKKNINDKVFRAKLASVMLDNKYDRRLRGRSRGKLDMKALPKVTTMAKSVFTQKQSRKNKAYNVCLLIDESGSMCETDHSGRSRSNCAAEATVFLAKNFDGLNINLSIIGFNRNVSVLKDWGSKIDYDKVFDDIDTRHNDVGSGDNNDYDAMYRGYRMFETAPKGKNILVMLSDGIPSQGSRSYYYDVKGNEENRLKIEKGMPEISRIEKEDEIHLHRLVASNKDVISIGVGIQEGGWQIPNHFVVNNLEDLKPQLIKTLKENIKRG